MAQTCDADWDCFAMYDGGEGFPALTSIVRAWGPSDDVAIGYELHEDGDDFESEFYLDLKRCSGSDCSSPSSSFGMRDKIGGSILHKPYLTPTMSIYKETVNDPLEVDILLRDRWDETGSFCGSTTTAYASVTSGNGAEILDISHVQWSGGTPGSPVLVEGSTTVGTDACDQHATGYIRTRQDTGDASACWRYNDDDGGWDRIHCGDQTGPTTWSVASVTPQGTNPQHQDHVSYDLDGSDRIAVYRSKEEVASVQNFRIRVRFLDDGGDPSVILATGANVDYPDFAVSSTGVYQVVWQDGSGNSSSIETARCESLEADCTNPTYWNYSTIDTGKNLKHATIATDGDRQFVVYMEDMSSTSAARYRIRYATRCDSGSWSYDGVQEPAYVTDDQGLWFGHPHVAADRGDNVLHVAFTEADDWENLYQIPVSSVPWWAARTYSDCP